MTYSTSESAHGGSLGRVAASAGPTASIRRNRDRRLRLARFSHYDIILGELFNARHLPRLEVTSSNPTTLPLTLSLRFLHAYPALIPRFSLASFSPLPVRLQSSFGLLSVFFHTSLTPSVNRLDYGRTGNNQTDSNQTSVNRKQSRLSSLGSVQKLPNAWLVRGCDRKRALARVYTPRTDPKTGNLLFDNRMAEQSHDNQNITDNKKTSGQVP